MRQTIRPLADLLRPAVSALAVLLLAAAAHGQVEAGPGGPLTGFQIYNEFQLHADGETVPAKVYRSSRAAAFLLVSEELDSPVLIQLRQQSVSTVGFLKLNEKADGTIDLLPGAVATDLGSFAVEGEGVSFEVGGRDMALKPKPYLVGFQGGDSLKAHSSDYERRADSYSPSAPILDKLRSQGQEVRVQVFFGSWCPACGQMVPRMVKVAEELDGSRVQVDFYGLPRSFGDDPEAKKLGIKSVPTGVVFVSGVEVGRITGNNWKIPELAIDSLLQGS